MVSISNNEQSVNMKHLNPIWVTLNINNKEEKKKKNNQIHNKMWLEHALCLNHMLTKHWMK